LAAAPAGWHHPGPELYPVMPDRIVALDLIRGVAVLGILAINIAGFADPLIATTTPHLPHPGTQADEIAFAASFLLFEGKMRALFTILFGASMLLFLERAEAAGKDAAPLQMRRLGWLMLFGYLHFALIWWGDILFVYALCGFIALAFRFMATRPLVIFALTLFVLSHAQGMAGSMPEVLAEEHASHGVAPPREAAQYRQAMLTKLTEMRTEVALYRGPYGPQVDHRLTDQRFFPLAMAIGSICETLPLMLLGMALYRSGFFSGGWPVRRLEAVAIAGIVSGGAATLAVLAWVWPRHFPPIAMNALLANGMAVPHLLLALGYAALLMLAAPRLLQLYRHEPRHDRDLLWLGARPVRHDRRGRAIALRSARLDPDARLEQALARAIQARAARMAVAHADRMASFAAVALNAIAIPSQQCDIRFDQ
jgi:uncharacterized protein